MVCNAHQIDYNINTIQSKYTVSLNIIYNIYMHYNILYFYEYINISAIASNIATAKYNYKVIIKKANT